MSLACVSEARAFLTISSERVSYVSIIPAVGGVRMGVWEAEGVRVLELTGGFTCVYALGC